MCIFYVRYARSIEAKKVTSKMHKMHKLRNIAICTLYLFLNVRYCEAIKRRKTMNIDYKRLYDNVCDIADVIREVAADSGVSQEQAAKAVEIAALMQLKDELNGIYNEI